MKSSTIASPFIINMTEGARRQGFNVSQILLDHGISPSILTKPGSRITFEQLAKLSWSLMTLLDDECYGLLSKPLRQNTFKLACYAAINGDTVEDALKIFTEFMVILDNGLMYEMSKTDTHSTYKITRRSGHQILNNYAIEYSLFSLHRTACWMADTRLPILSVTLDYPAPPYANEYRYMFYGAPTIFGQAYSSMSFSRESLVRPIVRNKHHLKQFLRSIPLTLLTHTATSVDIATRLRYWMESQLKRNKILPDINTAAESQALHPQALRRQLKRDGTSFQNLKMEIRRDLAINLMANSRISIEDVAFQLGFSEPSAFIRAFRAWTGLTPLAYKKLSQ